MERQMQSAAPITPFLKAKLEIACAIDRARDYFGEREDVTGDAGDIPTEEMSIRMELDEALKLLTHLHQESA